MATAKRLYLYIVSALGLGMAVIGTILMLELLLDRVGLRPTSTTDSYSLAISVSDKETLSIAIALVVVGLALWIAHWALVERMVLATGDEAGAERSSIVRSVYFSLLMATLLLTAAVLVAQTLSDVLGNLFDRNGHGSVLNYSTNLSITIVVMAAWGYHAWIRNRDLKQDQAITGAAAWFSRLYLYGILFAGVSAAVMSASSLISTIGNQLAAPSSNGLDNYQDLQVLFYPGSQWLRVELTALVGIGVGAALWATHWIYSNGLCAGQNGQGALERISRVRFGVMMLVVFAGAYAVVGGLASGLWSFLVWIFNLTPGGSDPAWHGVLFPVLAALPAAAAWLWHRRRAIAEGSVAPTAFSPRRIVDYTTAAVGMVAIAFGSYSAVSTILGRWFNPPPTVYPADYSSDSFWKITLASAVAVIAAGVTIWVEPWIAARRRRNTDHAAETTSSSRSYYLYSVAVFSMIAGAIGAAILVYLYTRLAVGLADPRLDSEVSMPLALVLVAGVLLAYHVRVLRSDPNPPVVRAAPAGAPVAPAETPAAPAIPAPADAPPADAPAPESSPKDGAAG